MGTRADFYVGRGNDAEWLGSIAWDGHPKNILSEITAANSDHFRDKVSIFLASRDDATLPEQGWPWPWDDSQTTDYAYAYDVGRVWTSCFGCGWMTPAQSQDPKYERTDGKKTAVFPDIKSRQNVTMGARSGVIVFGVKS